MIEAAADVNQYIYEGLMDVISGWIAAHLGAYVGMYAYPTQHRCPARSAILPSGMQSAKPPARRIALQGGLNFCTAVSFASNTAWYRLFEVDQSSVTAYPCPCTCHTRLTLV